MQDIHGMVLSQIQAFFACDQRRIKLISHLIIGLVKLTHSSLSQWSKALPGEQQLDTKYKQLQRFVRFFRFSPRLYAQVVWGLFGQEKVVYLTLDRSEWQMRGQWVQVVLVGIAHRGMSIPLLWQVLNRQGNTAMTTRRALLRCFDAWLDRSAGQQIWWLADREYVGKTWFQELTQRQMHFCIRLRKSVRVQQGGKELKLARLFECAHLRLLRKPRQVYGCKLYLAGQQLPGGDFFVVGSATKTRQLAAIYQKRWQIETLFAAYKSRGFHLERCRVNRAKRLKTLLFVLSLALLWAVKTGWWLIQHGKPIPLKNFKNQPPQRWKSLFRWGLDYLQNLLLNNLPAPPILYFCPV
jgi:hypothetical protein